MFGGALRGLGERRLRCAPGRRNMRVDRTLGVGAGDRILFARAQWRAARLDQEIRPVGRAHRRCRGASRGQRLEAPLQAQFRLRRREDGGLADRRVRPIARGAVGRGADGPLICAGGWPEARRIIGRSLRAGDVVLDLRDAVDKRFKHMVDAAERRLNSVIGVALLGAQSSKPLGQGLFAARRIARRR